MASELEICQIDKNNEFRWQNLLETSMFPSYMHLLQWEHIKTNYGRIIETFIYSINGEDVAGVSFSLKKSKGNVIIVADIWSGIVFKNTHSVILLDQILEHFVKWAEMNNASYARYNPWLPKTVSGRLSIFYTDINKIASSFKFKSIKKGPQTYWIDLKLPEDELLTKMKRQTRYEVKKALKSEAIFQIVEHFDNGELEECWRLYKDRGGKKGYKVEDEQYFKLQITTLVNHGFGNAYLIYLKDKLVNISISSNFGVSAYLYGAIINDHHTVSNIFSAGHLAQWIMIQSNKKKGAAIYDMGFCPGPVPVLQHPQYKIWRFKYGFGGDHVEYMPLYGKIIKPISGLLFESFMYNLRKC